MYTFVENNNSYSKDKGKGKSIYSSKFYDRIFS